MTAPSTGQATGQATGIERVDVVVIGDGPAGSALALACQRIGVDVLLVGDDAPWSSTYSAWADELPSRLDGGLVDVDQVLATVSEEVWSYGAQAHLLGRRYATFDNRLLLTALRDGVVHRRRRVERVIEATSGVAAGRAGAGRDEMHRVELDGGGTIGARLVIDAAGWPARFAKSAKEPSSDLAPAWQTALGVVLAEPPSGDLGRPTFMDFRSVTGLDGSRSSVGPHGVTTFCYSLPMTDGWLVEETVLAARPAIEPIALLPRLAARLGRHPDRLLADAVRTEYVRIPLGGSLPGAAQSAVAFGAAAGYVHAATGFSVAASIRTAPSVAEVIRIALSGGGGAVDASAVHEAVWPLSMRRTRVLHDFGLEVLLDLDDDEVRAFFDAFFELGIDDWSAYLRIDTSPAQVSAVMGRLFRSSSWPIRRRLAGRNPLALARLLRP